MTYAASTVSYWVGQANDGSAGAHPTGWTTGQRWSETAEEWRVMYTSASAQGIDTSTGRHPSGWASGQLWSETAAEWMAMYDIQFAIARDTSAGQSQSTIGTHHPTGWTNNQLWQTTAEQWNAMWGTEWRNSHDPQGYPHSYPGQAANAVFWSQSASYWRGQANYYWGPSRTWSSGGTWEGEANWYWGPTRTWNNGSTWEAIAGYNGWVGRSYQNGERWEDAYNRVYASRYNDGYAAGRVAYKTRAYTTGLNGNFGNDGQGFMNLDSGSPDGGYFTNDGVTIYLVRTGYYMCSANLTNFNQLGGQNCCGWTSINTHLDVNGTAYGAGEISLSYDSDDYHKGGYGWGFAGVLVYSTGSSYCRVWVNPAVMDGSPNFGGRLSVCYLGPEGP